MAFDAGMEDVYSLLDGLSAARHGDRRKQTDDGGNLPLSIESGVRRQRTNEGDAKSGRQSQMLRCRSEQTESETQMN